MTGDWQRGQLAAAAGTDLNYGWFGPVWKNIKIIKLLRNHPNKLWASHQRVKRVSKVSDTFIFSPNLSLSISWKHSSSSACEKSEQVSAEPASHAPGPIAHQQLQLVFFSMSFYWWGAPLRVLEPSAQFSHLWLCQAFYVISISNCYMPCMKCGHRKSHTRSALHSVIWEPVYPQLINLLINYSCYFALAHSAT